MNQQLKNRIKTFLWYLGIYFAVEGLSLLSYLMVDARLPQKVITISSLVIAQITKYLNNKLQEYNYKEKKIKTKKQ